MELNPVEVVKEVLIVEDDEIIASLIERFLQQRAYRVTKKVSSGEDAILACAEHIPDVVLMDIHLIGLIDGITATKCIKALFKIPVIFVSGTDDDITLSRAANVEPSSFIIKPFNAKDLYSNIEIAIRNDMLVKRATNFNRSTVQELGAAILSELAACFILDETGHILFLNSYAEHILAINRKEAISRPINLYLTFLDVQLNQVVPDAFLCVIRENLPGDTKDIAVRMKGESYRDVSIKTIAIHDSANEMIGIIMILHIMKKRDMSVSSHP